MGTVLTIDVSATGRRTVSETLPDGRELTAIESRKGWGWELWLPTDVRFPSRWESSTTHPHATARAALAAARKAARS